MRSPYDEKLRLTTLKFKDEMLERLAEKENHGYTGWDNRDEISDHHLAAQLNHDADEILYQIKSGVLPVEKKRLIDIANRAMMLWYRSKEEKQT